MKYYLSLFFFFSLYFLCNSQTYEFNILTTYSISRISLTNLERSVFSNKLDNSYFLELSKYDDKSKATIIDLKSKKIHYFEVLETKNKENEKEYNFKHIESKDLSKYSTYPKVFYNYKIIESDSLYKKIELTFYKNKRKKRFHLLWN